MVSVLDDIEKAVARILGTRSGGHRSLIGPEGNVAGARRIFLGTEGDLARAVGSRTPLGAAHKVALFNL